MKKIIDMIRRWLSCLVPALPEGTISIRVSGVDRGVSPARMLQRTGMSIRANPEDIASMPRGKGADQEELILLPVGRDVLSNIEVIWYLRFLWMKPADPYWVLWANITDWDLCGSYPHATIWRVPGGKWGSLGVCKEKEGRLVEVSVGADGWPPGGYIAAVRRK